MKTIRHVPTALLAVALLSTGACSAQLAGTPQPAPAAVTVASTAASTTGSAYLSTSAVPATTASTTSTASRASTVTSKSTSDPTTTFDPTTTSAPASTSSRTVPGTAEDTVTGPTGTVDTVDTVTQHWIKGMCTDMHGVLTAVFDVPDTTDRAQLAQYRQDYVDYYSHLSAAAQQALDGARQGVPPAVVHGPEIHQQFIRYLTGLQDIAASGAALIATEGSTADISADVTQLSKEMEDLGNGAAGLGDLSSPELASAIAAAPECRDLAG
jgi:hypothetical protein